MAEYFDEAGGNYSKTQAAKNPFLIAQSVSSTPLGMHGSPMKDFGILSIPLAIAAAAKAAAASAGTAVTAGAAKLGALAAKGGAAIAKGIGLKGISAKLAGTGAKLGAKATTKWAATKAALKTGVKGVTKSLSTKPTLKGVFSGKKAVVGAKSPGVASTEATKTGATEATKTATTTAEPKSFIQQQFSKENLLSQGKAQMSRDEAQGEEGAAGHRARQGEIMANLPSFEGGSSRVPKEDLSSVLTYKTGPFKLRSGNSPLFKHMGSPYKSMSKMKFDSALGDATQQVKDMAQGSGFGVNRVTFEKDK